MLPYILRMQENHIASSDAPVQILLFIHHGVELTFAADGHEAEDAAPTAEDSTDVGPPAELEPAEAPPVEAAPAEARPSAPPEAAPQEPTDWVDPSAGEIDTAFVKLPGLLSGECQESNGANVLLVDVAGDPADPRADDIPGDLTPEWGLHLVDVNLVMGDVVRQVAAQSDAWSGD